jgi:hypothetical protein
MKVYDAQGRLKIVESISLNTDEFILDDTGFYLKNQTDGLYYKLICETVDGIVIVRMEQTNVVFP